MRSQQYEKKDKAEVEQANREAVPGMSDKPAVERHVQGNPAERSQAIVHDEI